MIWQGLAVAMPSPSGTPEASAASSHFISIFSLSTSEHETPSVPNCTNRRLRRTRMIFNPLVSASARFSILAKISSVKSSGLPPLTSTHCSKACRLHCCWIKTSSSPPSLAPKHAEYCSAAALIAALPLTARNSCSGMPVCTASSFILCRHSVASSPVQLAMASLNVSVRACCKISSRSSSSPAAVTYCCKEAMHSSGVVSASL
mmetsp:Transcript_40169/g.93354  ORF Transcript_40169/g.93354 Transcript_40169/m.93354 type:complete len:204 (-) Transcript_40169:1239-1850(-)